MINDIKNMFFFYGFLESPISEKIIKDLIKKGYDKETIYKIGCDVYCGFNLNDILESYYD